MLGCSQELTTTCGSSFGVQTVEYRCIVTGFAIEWIVEPVIMERDVRFLPQIPFRNVTVGDIFFTHDCCSSYILPDHDALATTTVICNSVQDVGG